MQIKYKLSDVRGVVAEFNKYKDKNPHAHKLAQMMEQIFEQHAETTDLLNRALKQIKDLEKDVKRLKKTPTTVIRYEAKE